jgi:cytochrome bd-type quinol oxidase subunit 1
MMTLLSRWQFGVTITYHFLFVPLTIGLALLVAVMQVLAYRRRDETWDRLAAKKAGPKSSSTRARPGDMTGIRDE